MTLYGPVVTHVATAVYSGRIDRPVMNLTLALRPASADHEAPVLEGIAEPQAEPA